ncbi:MAG TPA: phenylalanine--tRNA ligase subunit alpha [Gaiellaceae bacterium]|nr:phenylalanine--tRNA ligase subunit alpha [Gaiellaceae bacterium]
MDTVGARLDWDPDSYESDARAALEGASTSEEVEGVSVAWLGRNSTLKLKLREVRDRETGIRLNAVREALEAAVEAKRKQVEADELERRLTTEQVDVTLPARMLGTVQPRRRGALHPSTLVRRDVEDIFLGLGYEIVDGREVETTRYNFDALGFPDWHPSRSPRASLYVGDETVLRTETSPAQIHKMESTRPPIYIISIGRVYRRDTIDATHFPIFHQFEGLAIDKGITMADLKGTLLYVMRQLYGPEREVRFRTHYFPFTEPSMEPDVSCFNCGGAGCSVCKHSGWIEMGGSGMVDPYLYEFVGWGPEEYTGFAFGMGIERTAQLRYGIPGIRPFWDNDVRFLRQFR